MNNDSIPDEWLAIPNASIVLICMMFFVSIGLFIMYRRKQLSGYRYSKVQLDEEEESNLMS